MARRGHFLEKEIDRVLTYLGSVGIHGHKNHARRTVDGVYLEGEPFDYEVFSHGVLHCFDAKECNGARWNLKNAKPNQVNALVQLAKHGARAYFLVYFVPVRKLRRFDALKIKEALSIGKKSLTAEEGADWNWQNLQGNESTR